MSHAETTATDRLDGQVALVTGGASGIGEATALLLAERGAVIAVVDRDLEGARSVADTISAAGGTAKAFYVDAAEEASVKAAVGAVAAELGAADILVNSAGIDPTGEYVSDMSLELWTTILSVNLTGCFLFMREVSHGMIKKGRGSVISISSNAAYTTPPHAAGYSTAKSGLNALNRVFAREVAEHGITVNVIAPGATDTPLARWYYAKFGLDMEQAAKESIDANPMKVVVKANDIAEMAAFLASRRGRYITGQIMHVNGGSWMGL